MRRALVALVVTVVAVVLLAGFDTEPPVTLNPNSALRPIATPRAIERPPPHPGAARVEDRHRPGRRDRRSRSSRCARR